MTAPKMHIKKNGETKQKKPMQSNKMSGIPKQTKGAKENAIQLKERFN